jgi:Adenine-specific methyltransferase EcoRI
MAMDEETEIAIQGKNSGLSAAKSAKKDEFYTQLPDIEREMKHYKTQFRDKVVYCNCDDPRVSNFFHYFSYNFEKLGLKKLITTCYKSQELDLFSQNNSDRAIWLQYDGDKQASKIPDLADIGIQLLQGDGDFRSKETIELLTQADIVVTNPPFSLFREYVAQLMEYEKKFLIIGHQNAIKYKGVFPLIKENKLWLGYGFPRNMAHFLSHYQDTAADLDHKDGMIRVSGVQWFTNLDTSKRHEELILYKTYNERDYPKYDNFDAIEVSKTVDIPGDYAGVMGVPITFLEKYNPDQFEIVGTSQSWFGAASKTYPQQIQVSANGDERPVTKLNDAPALKLAGPLRGKTYYVVDGQYFQAVYARLLIRNRQL